MGINSIGNSNLGRGSAASSQGAVPQDRNGASSPKAAGNGLTLPRGAPPSSAKKTPPGVDFSRSSFEAPHVKTPPPSLTFGKDAVPGAVSSFSQNVLKEIMSKVGISSATISSTARTPASQARAMYHNIEKTGVGAQKKLYGKYGDQVIDAYVSAKKAGMSREQTLQAMERKINDLGPSNVSRHLADPAQLNVVDIAPSSIPAGKRAAFEQALRKDPNVSKFLGPSDKDPAFHVEIKQPH